MKKTKDSRRQFSHEFKIRAIERVAEGEPQVRVARDLAIGTELLAKWRQQHRQGGPSALRTVGRPKGKKTSSRAGLSEAKRIAELEALVGRQQMEIGFLDRALHRVEELRQRKSDDGEVASSKR